MAVQTSLGVQCALVGNLQLVYGIVIDSRYGIFFPLFTFSCGFFCDGGGETAEGQPHEDTVEPHLVGVDGLVPEYLVGNGARLVFQLSHHGLHGQQVLLLGPVLVHTGDEVA